MPAEGAAGCGDAFGVVTRVPGTMRMRRVAVGLCGRAMLLGCLAAVAGCPGDNGSQPGTPSGSVTTASVTGRITVQESSDDHSVLEQEPNDTIDQAQFIATLAAGERYSILGSVAAGADSFDAFEFTADAIVQVSFSLSFTADGPLGPADLDVAIYDLKTASCYPGGAGPPTFTQCFDSTDVPETGSFNILGPFVIVVIPYQGRGQYVLDLTANAPGATAAPALIQASAAPKGAVAGGAFFAPTTASLVPGEVLVRFDPSTDAATRAAALARCALTEIETSPDGICRAEYAIDKTLAKSQRSMLTIAAAKRAAADPDVVDAVPNYVRSIAFQPNDEYYNLQWHYPMINLPEAWDITLGSDDVVVAVIDTGILPSHPDLVGRIGEGYDFISNVSDALDGDGRDTNPEDPGDRLGGPGRSSFHGTHVAGTIAATGNNGLGVTGVAPFCRILPLRALGRSGQGTDFEIGEAIRYAAGLPNVSGRVPARRAGVINMSLSGGAGTPGSSVIHSAVQAAVAANVVVVAAAGNDGSTDEAYPAAFSEVIAVGAVDLSQQLTRYSNHGSWLDLVAPGGNLGQDLNGDGWADGVLSTGASDAGGTIEMQYRFENGTSMASPHVAGLAALLLTVNPSLTPADVRDILETTARDLGASGRDNTFGYGLIDAAAAVREAQRRAGATPTTTPRLALSTSALDFGQAGTELIVSVSNTGGGMLNVTSVTPTLLDGDGWLSVSTEGPGPNTNVSAIDVHVARNGLANGVYRGQVTVSAEGVAAQTVDVRMTVGAIGALENNPVYVLAVDPDTLRTIGQDITSAARNYEYRIEGLPAGRYALYAGTDRNEDTVICDVGDLCGALPSTIDPLVVNLQEGQALTGADFAIALQVVRPAGSGRTASAGLTHQ